MKQKDSKTLQSFLVELAVYSLLMFAYFWAVLHFASHWLKTLFDGSRPLYATVALALMIGQAVGLEILTRWMVGFIGRRLA
jgi:hypothetical protein